MRPDDLTLSLSPAAAKAALSLAESLCAAVALALIAAFLWAPCMHYACAVLGAYVAAELLSTVDAYVTINYVNHSAEKESERVELAQRARDNGLNWLCPDVGSARRVKAEQMMHELNAFNETYSDSGVERRMLGSDGVSMMELLSFWPQKINYYIKALVAIPRAIELYMGWANQNEDEVTPQKVVEFYLNTDMAAMSTFVKRTEAGYIIKFERGGIALPYPALREKFDNVIRIELFVPHPPRSVDDLVAAEAESGAQTRESLILPLPGSYVESFTLNGDALTDPRDQLNVIQKLVPFVIHPQVHSLGDGFRSRIHNGLQLGTLHPSLFHMIKHVQYLNLLAMKQPAYLMDGGMNADGTVHPWIGRFLMYSSALPMDPMHGTMSSLLAPLSRYLTMMTGAHRALKAEWVRFQVQESESVRARVLPSFGRSFVTPCGRRFDMDFEDFFQNTVGHALDHFFMGNVHDRQHFREGASISDKSMNDYLSLVFFCETKPYVDSNLVRDRVNENPFYAAVYRALRGIDERLADEVTLSITY